MNTILLLILSGIALLFSPVAGTAAPRPVQTGVHPLAISLTLPDFDARLLLPPAPPGRIIGSGSFTLCEGDSVILYTTPTFRRYRWTNGDTNSAIVVKDAGSYGVTVTDASGGTFILDPVAVTIIPRPRVSISTNGPLTICDGDSVLLDAGSGFASYFWSNGVTTRTLTVRQSGVYWVSVTGSNGCPATSASVKVNVGKKPNPKIFATRGFEVCEGDTTILYGYGGYAKYRWSTGDTTQSLIVTGPGDWDDYRLTVTDSNGCSATSEIYPVKFHVRPLPRILVDGPKQFCEGDSITLDGGSIYNTYRWSTGEIGRKIIVKEPGRYWVSVTDGIGCPGQSDTVTIVVNKRPTAAISGPGAVCPHSTAVYTAPKRPGQTYIWGITGPGAVITAGQGTESVTVQWGFPGTAALTLVVRVDSSGCTSMTATSVDVGNVLKPKITSNRSTTLCTGDTVVLDGGYGYTSYKWSTGATTQRISVGAPGAYTVTVGNDIGCSGTSDPMTVTAATPPKPVITSNRPTALCFGDSVRLDAGAGYASYDWTNGEKTQTILVRNAGSYAVTVTDRNGCVGASGPVFVVLQPPPTPRVLGPNVVCRASTAIYEGSRDGGILFDWKVTGGTLLTPPNAQAITVQWGGSGGGEITLTETVQSTGCSGTATMQVTVGDSLQPVVRTVGSPILCSNGGSVTLDAGSGYKSYLWSTGATSRTITVETAGAFVVSVVDSGGCSGSSQPYVVAVRPSPVPVIEPLGALTICEGDSIRLYASPGFADYLWSTGETTPSILVTRAGDYSVTVHDSVGCVGRSLPSRVKLHPRPEAPTITLAEDSLVSTPAVSYVWSRDGVTIPGATGRTIPLQGDGTYRVRITDNFGCSSISGPIDPYTLLATTVAMPTMEGAAGDTVMIPLVLDAPRNLLETGESTFTAKIRFNKSILMPIGSTPLGVIDGRDRVITVDGVRPAALTEGALLTLAFRVMLGDSARTAIAIDEFTWNTVQTRAKTVNGVFTLTDLCGVGGLRLLRSVTGTALKPSRPNPATGITEIEYDLAEQGHTRLVISDPLGRRVMTLVDGELAPGRYVATFDARDLSSGLYLYTLETPTERLSRTMVVQR